MNELLIYFSACIVTAMFVLSLLGWRFPQWSVRRISLLSASPVPALTLAVCAIVAVRTALTPPDRCGVDGCGIAMGFAEIVAVIALVGFVLTWAICAALLILKRRRR